MRIKLLKMYLGNPVGTMLDPGKGVAELLIQRKVAVKIVKKKKKVNNGN